jgi:mono/diheme cytochrome c family protein
MEIYMRLTSLLALAAVLGAAVPGLAADKAPSFTKDVKPFLAKYCVECHGAGKPKAGLNVSSFDDLMKGGKKKVIVAGKAEESLLIKTMEGKGKPMPPKKYEKQPTAKEIDLVKAWINAGAKDDSADAKGALSPKTEDVTARREQDE